MGCQDVRTTLWKARANSETDRVSDKLFTGFLEGASAIFQSVKVAFLPSEQCLIVVCKCVCVLFLDGFECLHCVSGWQKEIALPLHLKALRKGQEGGKGQNLSSTLSEPPELCLLTFLPTLPPSPHPLWKISLGNRICPHKKQKSADAA